MKTPVIKCPTIVYKRKNFMLSAVIGSPIGVRKYTLYE